MNYRPVFLELLSPAKNADFGIEAINHGADAVYIGGPGFGARAGAGNSLADIERLSRYAHRFNARVLLALNTILRDDELDHARRLAWQAFEAGVDALIVQDMGLLEIDLPPIELHASTQCNIRTPQKARFLEDVGFSQMVLARELSLAQIRAIAAQTSVPLEFFVHGALCVSYSGQCYLSHAQTGRSANRGDCSQACRLPWSLADQNGTTLVSKQHLLSLKDNDQSHNLRALIEAGIRSFKIEGRLKDLSYVKNITAHYRQQLDALMDASNGQWQSRATGRCHFLFTPQPEKTFNRGATDYFVNERRDDIGAFASPKFVGEAIGQVARRVRNQLEITSSATLNNGDGLTWFTPDGELTGLRINLAEPIPGGFRLSTSLVDGRLPAELQTGTQLYRNHDQHFERLLEKKSAERRIPLHLCLTETPSGFALEMRDEAGLSAQVRIEQAKEVAQNAERTLATLRDNLSRLGNTLYQAASLELVLSAPWFIPGSVLNNLRRDAVEALDAARAAAWQRPARRPAVEPPVPYPEETLSYLGNVFNRQAQAFYARHGVRLIEPAYECQQEKGEVSLMITRHCLRYSLHLCPKQVKGLRPEPLILMNGKEKLQLRFDCKACEMHVVGRLKTLNSGAESRRAN